MYRLRIRNLRIRSVRVTEIRSRCGDDYGDDSLSNWRYRFPMMICTSSAIKTRKGESSQYACIYYTVDGMIIRRGRGLATRRRMRWPRKALHTHGCFPYCSVFSFTKCVGYGDGHLGLKTSSI